MTDPNPKDADTSQTEVVEEQETISHDDDSDDFDSESCPTCGQIDGTLNPCCSGYDPLNFMNCGYG